MAKYYTRKRKGVKKGFKHNWKYKGHWKEKKVGKGIWRIDFRATKGRKARSYGGYAKGSRLKWKINATQYAIKTGKGTYQTRMIGTKRLIQAKIRNR